MSVPNIPNITPEICLEDNSVANLMLSSIALEEIALSHLIEAESLKLTSYINSNSCSSNYFDEVLTINKSIESILDKVHSIESILTNKVKMISEMKIYSKNNKSKNTKSSSKINNTNSNKFDIHTFSTSNCDFSFNKEKR